MPRKFFRRLLPRQHKVRENRVMAWLWHVSREGIARGVAIGGFFGLIAQFGHLGLSLLGVDVTTDVTPDAFAAGSATRTNWLGAWRARSWGRRSRDRDPNA